MAARELSPAQSLKVEVTLAARDRLALELDVRDGSVEKAKLTAVGCTELLRLVGEWRAKLRGPLAELPLPDGDGHAAILMREMILKAQGRWQFPYNEEELCHCRAVSTAKVDAAIIGGCHGIQSVARETSAGTSCGTCRVDTDAIIKYRLQK